MQYHLIGDQGVSMRGLAKCLKFKGHSVSGSDLKTGGHKAENISANIDVVVRSSAANDHSEAKVELDEARRLGIKVIKRSELIKELLSGKKVVAVSGMHGKTTVTTMAGLVLERAGLDPTVLVGADVPEYDGTVRIGQSDLFVLEACEYDRAILDFYPDILILTNIEEEHLDTYSGGLPEIKEAFIEYINHVPDDGAIIAYGGDANVRDTLSKVSTKAKVIYYGEGTDYDHLEFTLDIPGNHNILNALSVIALADYLKIDRKIAEEVLSQFKNAHRRFEKLGNFHGADLIDDYGHHPTEIKATLEALKERYAEKKKYVFFWPHQYKRILPLIEQFGAAFDGADEVILKPIYYVPGRDEKLDICSEDLAQRIENQGISARVFETDEEICNYLKTVLDERSVLLTIGIPPAYKVIEKLLQNGGK